jgi:flavin reductase (DIM6/NTAB) family NADH-FMN oxidoreductase RutF
MISESLFRQTLAQFATGITVVTTRDGDGRPFGLTVNAFCSVSLDPPQVLVCIDRRSDANPGLTESGMFNVSVLSEGQQETSRRFATRGVAKFEGDTYPDGQNGLPTIPGAVALIECRVVAAHLSGDHTIYVGEVTRLECRGGLPLLYHASAYRRLDSAAQDPA